MRTRGVAIDLPKGPGVVPMMVRFIVNAGKEIRGGETSAKAMTDFARDPFIGEVKKIGCAVVRVRSELHLLIRGTVYTN
jgi:hypothetical protein